MRFCVKDSAGAKARWPAGYLNRSAYQIEAVMNSQSIRDKYGNDFVADDHTFKLGIDQCFAKHISHRFRRRNVLETCTGAGFTTIALVRVATSVATVEINPSHLEKARQNLKIAGSTDNVTFILGDILDEGTLKKLPPIDSAFLDPDWADTEPDHEYKFINSNTRPPADVLLDRVFRITENVALILPPNIDNKAHDFPLNRAARVHFLEALRVPGCLYFGKLISALGETEFRVKI